MRWRTENDLTSSSDNASSLVIERKFRKGEGTTDFGLLGNYFGSQGVAQGKVSTFKQHNHAFHLQSRGFVSNALQKYTNSLTT